MLVGDKIIRPIHTFIMRYKRASKRSKNSPSYIFVHIRKFSVFLR